MFYVAFPLVTLLINSSPVTVSHMTLIESKYTPWMLLVPTFHWWVVIPISVPVTVPPLFGAHFCLPGTFIHFPLTYWCLYHIPSWYYDAHYCVVPPPSFLPPFSCFFLCPPQLSGVFISLFLTYRHIVIYNTNIFDQREVYWGPWMRCRSHHALLSLYISCTLNVSFPGAQNTNSFIFNGILNDTAKKTK